MQFNRLRRREFITLLGGAAVWSSAARGQLPAKLPIIGFLGAASPSVGGQWFAAFVQKLRDLGWVEGRNIAIEARWAEGRGDRAAQIAAEFVRLNVDLIVTWSTESALAAKRATSAIPIVFALSTDPVGSGLVASLARPGGNATGFSVQTIDIAGKRLGLLREIVPKLGRLALLANVSVTDTAMEMREIQKIARQLGIDVVATLEIRQREDITPAFETLKVQPDALFVVGDPLTFTNRSQINTLALGARLPTMYSIREFVAAGGLMSYGTNFPDLFRRSAEFSDKILRGAKPADIPVEQPTKFDLVINRTTAKALGLTVPDTLLALADEIIE